MGVFFSSIFSSLFGRKEVRVLILGLDNAGKTTILCACCGCWSCVGRALPRSAPQGRPQELTPRSHHPVHLPPTCPTPTARPAPPLPPADRLQVDEPVTTVPTIGFNVETLSYKNIKFQVWDLGGQTSIRPYWRCYYPNTDAIIFVVDSTDVERLELSKTELFQLLEVRPGPAGRASAASPSRPTFFTLNPALRHTPAPLRRRTSSRRPRCSSWPTSRT